MSTPAQTLYDLLPALYKLRDAGLAPLTAAETVEMQQLLGAGPLNSTQQLRLKVLQAQARGPLQSLLMLIDEQLANSVPLTQEWINEYAVGYQPPPHRGSRASRESPTAPFESPTIVPNSMQSEALIAIASLRDGGAERSLVISATGTGKTILAALDVRQVDPARVLFVAHREQILDRAIREFTRVLGGSESDFGKLAGTDRQSDRRFVFATVQTLSQPDVYQSLDPEAFDYILIDEVHRAGAASYVNVINYFHPQFLLGMTATPERSDDISIFELFDFNVPYEIRLKGVSILVPTGSGYQRACGLGVS